ncbi:MAG TPA: hypothetical protein VNO30_37165 [Kofleriaceae bacterium]|nr:hypothetical protein [Kofleriaceae bacterium]
MPRLCSIRLGPSGRLAFAVALALAGCVADGSDAGFLIRNNLAPDEDACTFMPSANAPFLARGTIHTRASSPYLLAPLIESRITAAMGQESVRTVALQGAKIDLAIGPITVEDAQGALKFSCAAEGANACFGESELAELAAAGTTKFRSLFSAPLAPNGGLTTAAFDLVPTAAIREIERKTGLGTIPDGARLHAQVVATATLYGQLGNSEVSGLPFVYPVAVCSDCVVNVVGTCADTPQSFDPRPGNPCNPYQDGTLDCCTGPTGLVCPAVGQK